jgi:hypothetical protein
MNHESDVRKLQLKVTENFVVTGSIDQKLIDSFLDSE